MKAYSPRQPDVMAELGWEPAVHAAPIGVEVKDGVVTLVSEVSSHAETWNAESAAQRVSGVKALAVEVTLTGTVPARPNGTSPRARPGARPACTRSWTG